MIAYYFNKPIQGRIFKKFKNVILGINEEDIETYKTHCKQALIRIQQLI